RFLPETARATIKVNQERCSRTRARIGCLCSLVSRLVALSERLCRERQVHQHELEIWARPQGGEVRLGQAGCGWAETTFNGLAEPDHGTIGLSLSLGGRDTRARHRGQPGQPRMDGGQVEVINCG